MAGRIHGITVTLYETTANGADAFNKAIYTETAVPVDNVLVAPTSDQEQTSIINLYGKRAVYTMAIPKGDAHDWQDKCVRFFGKNWHTFGVNTEGIEQNIPLSWNKKVLVERFDFGTGDIYAKFVTPDGYYIKFADSKVLAFPNNVGEAL